MIEADQEDNRGMCLLFFTITYGRQFGYGLRPCSSSNFGWKNNSRKGKIMIGGVSTFLLLPTEKRQRYQRFYTNGGAFFCIARRQLFLPPAGGRSGQLEK